MVKLPSIPDTGDVSAYGARVLHSQIWCHFAAAALARTTDAELERLSVDKRPVELAVVCALVADALYAEWLKRVS